MLYGLVVIVHVLVCLFLIGVILLQGGRGGLSEAMGGAAAQSLFGTGAATILTRITTGIAALFMTTCLALAAISNQQGRSVIDQLPITLPEALPGVLDPDAAIPVPADEAVTTPAPEAPAEAPQPDAAAPQPDAAAPQAVPAEPGPPEPAAAPQSEPASAP